MPQFRTIQRTIEAEQYDGTNDSLLTKWGVELRSVPHTEMRTAPLGEWRPLFVGDHIVKVHNGFVIVENDVFQQEYVGANPDDRQEVVFKMVTTGGEQVTASVYGWKNGRDAVHALMHIGKPEVVLEFIKEQINSGDMSMLTMMNELAAKANPGE